MKRDKKSTGVARAPEKSSEMLPLSQIEAGRGAISIPQIKTKKAPIYKELLVLPDYDLARSSFCRSNWARAVFRSSLSKGPPMIFCK